MDLHLKKTMAKVKDKTIFHPTAVARHGTPDVRFDFGLVGYGYQVDTYIRGEAVSVQCRDFGGSHSVKALSKELETKLRQACARAVIGAMGRTLKKFRESH